jgi:tetratricopeptide (TPR) repeat protein
MIREALAQEYVTLARQFLALGAVPQAVDCVSTALKLDPGSQAALEVLRLSAEMQSPCNPCEADPAALDRLEKRKRRLDRLARTEWQVAQVSFDLLAPDLPDRPKREERAKDVPGDSGSPPPAAADGRVEADGDNEGAAADLHRRLGRLNRRLEGVRTGKTRELIARVEALAQALRREMEGKPPLPPQDDDDEPGLSLEHEFHNTGNDFYKIGRFDDAITCYNIALELRPDLLETFFNRGLAYTRKCSYGKALEDLTKVMELNPNLAEAAYTRGLIKEYMTDYDAAIKDYEKALEIDPAYAKAQSQRDVASGKKRGLEAPPSASSGPSASRREEGQIRDFSRYLERPAGGFSDVWVNRRVRRQMSVLLAFLKGHEAIEAWGVARTPPRGVLLHGPPGCGKTAVARALAGTVRVPFYCVPSTVFINLYYGNTEANLRNLWEEAASHQSGAIIFLDEFDALASRRTDLRATTHDDCHNRTVATLLALMDGMQTHDGPPLVVIGATNCLGNIDKAFRRPGRFNYLIEVLPPSTPRGMAALWLIHLGKADENAECVDALDPIVGEAVRGNRDEWLDRSFRPGAPDPSGLVEVTRFSLAHCLTGDEVREVVRRTIMEKVMAWVEWGHDLGPITATDLMIELREYVDLRLPPDDEGPQDQGGLKNFA